LIAEGCEILGQVTPVGRLKEVICLKVGGVPVVWYHLHVKPEFRDNENIVAEGTWFGQVGLFTGFRVTTDRITGAGYHVEEGNLVKGSVRRRKPYIIVIAVPCHVKPGPLFRPVGSLKDIQNGK